MKDPWTIQLLGRLRARQGHRLLTRFRTQKTGALLAYLAHHRHTPHDREALIEMLWPGRAPQAGRNSLSVELSFLRHQLEPPGTPTGSILIADRFSIQLNPARITTDVAAFEQALTQAKQAKSPQERVQFLSEAVGWYQGPLLPGHDQEWVLIEQRRLAEEFGAAIRRVIQDLERAKDWEQALLYARRAVAADPFCEEACHMLMRLLVRADQPSAALRQYRALVHRLDRELGEAPSPSTQGLARQIQEVLKSQDSREKLRHREVGTSKPSGFGLASAPAVAPSAPANGQDLEAGPPQAVPAPAGQLPQCLTRFFGREAELSRLEQMLLSPQIPLVTLTGPGGIGKTRLAQEVARRLSEWFPGGVWYAGLADLSDPALIADALRQALGLPPSAEGEPLEQVTGRLSKQPALLVLDNVEQVVEESARVVQTLLDRVPTLTCLITSRQVLSLAGEHEMLVAALPLPQGADLPEQLLANASAQLFVDRAQRARPGFQVTRRNASAVASVCARLEGIPLALELAAAWASVLTPSQMLSQLGARFAFLVSRRREVSARHRTLKAALDWSYVLLSPGLRRFFVRLSVFRGGWSLEAAESVCDEPLALDFLAQLRECSLVQVEESGDTMRFFLLETLREYGQEKLAEIGEAEAVRGRHLAFFLGLAEEAEGHLTGAEQAAWLEHLEAEHDNLRVALDWSLKGSEAGQRPATPSASQRPDTDWKHVEAGLRLAGALSPFWQIRGYLAEGRARLLGALARSGASTASRAKALNGAGVLAIRQGDYALARSLHEESLAIRRELGDKRGIAVSLSNLGQAALHQGSDALARSLYEESLAIRRRIGDKQGIAVSLSNLGRLAFGQGDYALAHSFYDESIVLWREVGDTQGIAHSLFDLGTVALEQGDYALARSLYEEGLAIRRRIGDKRGIAVSLLHLGTIARSQDDYALARSLYEEGLAIRRRIGDKRGIAVSLNELGELVRFQGDYALARSLYQESLTLYRELGSQWGVAYSLHNLGEAARSQDDYALARSLYQESLTLWREIGDKRGIAHSLGGLAALAVVQGQTRRAARLLGAEEALRQALGAALLPDERDDRDRSIAVARAALGEEAFAASWEQGRAMSPEQATQYALEEESLAQRLD